MNCSSVFTCEASLPAKRLYLRSVCSFVLLTLLPVGVASLLMATQNKTSGSSWDLGPAFDALSEPYKKTSHAEQSDYFDLSTPQTHSPSLNRALSGHDDNDETPKATQVEDSISTLGDLSKALLSLGYSVEIIEPTNKGDHATILAVGASSENITLSTDQTLELKQEDAVEISDKLNPENSRVEARRAENMRRDVLQSFLGTSPKKAYEDNAVQKSPRRKTISKADGNKGIAKVLDVSSLPRKFVNMQLAAEKKLQLTMELHKRFPENIELLYGSNDIPGCALSVDPEGIHVFVDISNILIGFHDTLKRNRQISRNIRVPRQRLSFHNFSMVLERGRPVAKRFLAGSDDIDCTQEARILGYTTHILQRVDKLDTSTNFGRRKGVKSGLTSSDTDSGTPGRTKRAEQAVDEVLHLGMLQSLLDVDTPSTIVLASGDAAKAEFSDGFLRQVERALLKGWKVEVVSFQMTTSYAYRDPAWVSRWGKSFRFIPLDEFAELLHIPYEGSSF